MEIKSIETVLKECGWPTFSDFENNRVFINQSYIEKVVRILKVNNRCLVLAGEGRGKTVLARSIAYSRYINSKNSLIVFLDLREAGPRDSNISIILDQIRRAIEAAEKKDGLFIIENAHIYIDTLTSELLEMANETNKENISFIFTARKGADLSYFDEFYENGLYVELMPEINDALNIINAFIRAERIGYNLTTNDVEWLKGNFGLKPINLRILSLYLAAWKEEYSMHNTNLYCISREKVLDKIYQTYFGVSVRDERSKRALYKVAGVCKFDVGYYIELSDADYMFFEQLKNEGIISSVSEPLSESKYYMFQHSSDAKFILEAYASKNSIEVDIITKSILIDYFGKRPRNYLVLLKAVNRNDRILLRKLLDDNSVINSILYELRNSKLIEVGGILSVLKASCDLDKAKNLWNEYKNIFIDFNNKIRSMLREAKLSEIYYFLNILQYVDNSEKDFIINNYLDLNDIKLKLEMAKLRNIVRFIKLLPDNKKDEILNQLNWEKITDITKESRIQTIGWFIRDCIQENIHKKVPDKIKKFLNSIKEDLVSKLREKRDYSVYMLCLSNIKKVDRQTYEYVKSKLNENIEDMIINSGLNTVARFIWKCWEEQDAIDMRNFVINILKKLMENDFSKKIKDLYDNPQVKPIKALGILLTYFYYYSITSEDDKIKNLIRAISDNIVNDINLEDRSRYRLEDLSYLVNRIESCNDNAYRRLCERIISKLNLDEYLRTDFNMGIASMIMDIYKIEKDKGTAVVKKVFELDINELINNSETTAVSMLIWNMLQIDKNNTINWIKRADMLKWQEKIEHSKYYEIFWLLWTLYQASKDSSIKNIIDQLINKACSKLKNETQSLDVPDIALYGFICLYNNDLLSDLKGLENLDIYRIARWLSKEKKLIIFAFIYYFLKCKEPSVLNEFLVELSRNLFLRNINIDFNEYIEIQPFESAKEAIRKITSGFCLLPEPSSTFATMISKTKELMDNKRIKNIGFTNLVRYMVQSKVFRNENAATKWINYAINYGIYNSKKVPHITDPNGFVTLLSLNLISSIKAKSS